MNLRIVTVAFVLWVALPATALARGQQTPAAPPDATSDDQDPVYEEQVVVTASRTDQQLVNAPAAVSIVTSETIQNSPAASIGELLRTLPGVNVAQVSARDINITTRGATSTLTTSQLALVDGRSIYLDFFGMVMWDLVPTSATEIKQIEVIRGPASAVWGANAMTGVVNVITKTPRELAAERRSSLTISAGVFDRNVTGRPDSAGSLFSVSGTHAEAVDNRWSYKVSAGYFTQDALPRPAGTLPNRFNTPYPPFANDGTSQPRFDGRVDYDADNGARVTVSGGVAGTAGVIHTGIGPFDIAGDSRMTYLTTRYRKGNRRFAFFTNLLNGNAANLLTRGLTGQPLPLDFITRTFDVEASDLRTIRDRHVVSFGGNYRRNVFDISLAPEGDNRNEGGGYVQDEIFLNDHLRWVVGGRVDKFSSIENAVFSPRTTLLIKPSANQTFRVSFNRAFRAPSFVNNNISTTILNEVNLSALSPALGRFVFPIRAIGNPDLKQETMTAYEVGFTGVIGNRATVTAAVYWNETRDGIFFTPVGSYTPANPPPGWPLPPAVLGVLAALNPPVVLPSLFTYRNLGTVHDKGIELGVDAAVNRYLNVFANYSLQADPTVEGFDISEANLPPNNRFNAGLNFNYSRLIGDLTASHTSEAFWQDVLDARYAGTTKPYTLVNMGVGARWAGDRVVTSLKIANLANRQVAQHVFGDVLRRRIVGELRLAF